MALIKRFLPWRRRQSSKDAIDRSNATSHADPAEAAGQLLRQQREQRGLSLRDLSRQVRITTPVLEALERNWPERLPEAAYLVAMLHRLEESLELEPGSLSGALPEQALQFQGSPQTRRTRFTVGSIDIFTTWQGSVVYAVLIGISLLMINRQQQNLALRNSQSLEPVRADLSGLDQTTSLPSNDPDLKALRPLDLARQRQPIDWLNAGGGPPLSRPGVLSLKLTQPRQLQVASGGGDRLQLQLEAGTATLQLLAPVQVVIKPPPEKADQLLWNGQVLKADKTRPGTYRVEATRAAAPAPLRPQTAPRSP